MKAFNGFLMCGLRDRLPSRNVLRLSEGKRNDVELRIPSSLLFRRFVFHGRWMLTVERRLWTRTGCRHGEIEGIEEIRLELSVGHARWIARGKSHACEMHNHLFMRLLQLRGTLPANGDAAPYGWLPSPLLNDLSCEGACRRDPFTSRALTADEADAFACAAAAAMRYGFHIG